MYKLLISIIINLKKYKIFKIIIMKSKFSIHQKSAYYEGTQTDKFVSSSNISASESSFAKE